MRILIYQALMNNDDLTNECGDRIYQAGSLGVGKTPALPQRPYVLITELPGTPYPEVRRTSTAILRTFQIWVYDERGDLELIDKLLGFIHQSVLGLILQKEGATGAVCIESRWSGDSQDIVMDQSDLNCKYSLFQLTSTQ